MSQFMGAFAAFEKSEGGNQLRFLMRFYWVCEF